MVEGLSACLALGGWRVVFQEFGRQLRCLVMLQPSLPFGIGDGPSHDRCTQVCLIAVSNRPFWGRYWEAVDLLDICRWEVSAVYDEVTRHCATKPGCSRKCDVHVGRAHV